MLKKETVTTAATVAICFGIVFLAVGTSETFQSCIGEHYHHESSETLQKGVAQLLMVSKVGSGCFGEFVHKNAEAIIALFTVIVGIATLLLWQATKKLVKGADDTARRQLRAYVFLDPGKEFTFARKMSTTATVEVEIHVKNLGATPAHEIIGYSWMHLDVWPLPQTFQFTGPVEGQPSAKFVLPPGAATHYHTGSARPLTAEEIAAVENGDLSIYVFGRIEYKDAFNRPHWTNFCFATTALGKEGFSTATAKCDRHNDADNN